MKILFCCAGGMSTGLLMQKLQKYAVGKFTKAETEQIQKYIDCLITDLELKT